ncbi:MAG: sulfatase, partial [Verrucomicrobiota bacterium]
RGILKRLWWILLIVPLTAGPKERPNILFCISDDQSYAHTGANGDPVVKTPAFDRISREGIRFTRAFCDAPTCGPSRSALLTGQPIWRLEEAGNIHSTLPAKFVTYTELLAEAGYVVGYTGKGWSPGRNEPGGRTENPAGKPWQQMQLGRGALRRLKRPAGMSPNAYAKNFEAFLRQRPEDKPFCFWLGTSEPHRGFAKGSGIAAGKDPARVVVPPCFPDHPEVRSDILDYYEEVEHVDRAVAEAMALLEVAGELDRTIVVVTSDHGMPFPRAKASLYDLGTRVPLAIRWPGGIQSPGRVWNGFVNLSDLAPTFLEAAGLKPPAMMIAHSLMPAFASPEAKPRPHAFSAMERHDGCRKGGKGYPCRSIRTGDFLYIKNFEPSRWPSGNPDARVCARAIPYGEVDSSPTKTLMMNHAEKKGFRRLHELAFGMRPAVELYDLANDPGQLVNVADEADHAETLKWLDAALMKHLVETGDPRALGQPAPWDYYPYYGRRRNTDWTVDAAPKP